MIRIATWTLIVAFTLLTLKIVLEREGTSFERWAVKEARGNLANVVQDGFRLSSLVRAFKHDEGRLPTGEELESLAGKAFTQPPMEFFSTQRGQSRIVTVKDDLGGWYYDEETGVIGLNLREGKIINQHWRFESSLLQLDDGTAELKSISHDQEDLRGWYGHRTSRNAVYAFIVEDYQKAKAALVDIDK